MNSNDLERPIGIPGTHKELLYFKQVNDLQRQPLQSAPLKTKAFSATCKP